MRALHELSAISVAPDRELTEGKQGRPSLSPTSTSHPARHLGRCLPPSLSNICDGTAGMQKELAKPGLSAAISWGMCEPPAVGTANKDRAVPFPWKLQAPFPPGCPSWHPPFRGGRVGWKERNSPGSDTSGRISLSQTLNVSKLHVTHLQNELRSDPPHPAKRWMRPQPSRRSGCNLPRAFEPQKLCDEKRQCL